MEPGGQPGVADVGDAPGDPFGVSPPPVDGDHLGDLPGTSGGQQSFHEYPPDAVGRSRDRDDRPFGVAAVLWANLARSSTHSGRLPANVTVETFLSCLRSNRE
ncbi:hypothetical protein GCM10027294_16150 [Marinactinospora endophytica]